MENTNQPNEELQKEAVAEETGKNTPETFETLTGSPADADAAMRKLQDELAEARDKYLRLYSEFDNFRKRTLKEKSDLILTASEGVLTKMLPVLDDFERAEKAFQGSNTKEAEGFLLIASKFRKLLEQAGVKVMDLKPGDAFNADWQEAITQIPVQDEALKGNVVDIVEKGYQLNEKVIRYAKVVVGN